MTRAEIPARIDRATLLGWSQSAINGSNTRKSPSPQARHSSSCSTTSSILSNIEAGKYQLESAAFDPGQLVHEARTRFASTSSDKGLCIESGWNGLAEQSYLGDPLRLNQMLSNLVSNAIKFTGQGVIRIEAREIERDQTSAVPNASLPARKAVAR